MKKGDYVKVLKVEYPHKMNHLVGNVYQIRYLQPQNRRYMIKDSNNTSWFFHKDELESAEYVDTPLYKVLNGS